MNIVYVGLGIIFLSIVSGAVTIRKFCYICVEEPEGTTPLEETDHICEYCQRPVCEAHSVPHVTDHGRRRCFNCLP